MIICLYYLPVENLFNYNFLSLYIIYMYIGYIANKQTTQQPQHCTYKYYILICLCYDFLYIRATKTLHSESFARSNIIHGLATNIMVF